jgi:hypothetical protein
MTTLADQLNFVTTTLQKSPLCRVVRIIETDNFSRDQFALKIRTELPDNHMLQVRLYYNQGHVDYAYQFVRNHTPILRWDNKEHFPALSSNPHHFHNASGLVENSPLTGDPVHDLPLVLDYLASTLS